MKLEKNYNVIFWILGVLAVGFLCSFVTGNNANDIYQNLSLPTFAPPSYVYPVVWTILYIFIGISGYLYSMSSSSDKTLGYLVFFMQLFLNFMWSIAFFGLNNCNLAFIIIVLLDIFVFFTLIIFENSSKIAGKLFYIYFIWCLFATVLNFSICIMN